jgi:hypothetical protein
VAVLRLTLLLALLAVLCGAASVFADGRVYPAVDETASIPDQQALIHWKAGVETLVIETRFQGSGRDFAWLIPTPARPEILPITTGLFPTIRAMLRPELHETESLQGMAAVGVLASIVAFLMCVLRGWSQRVLLLICVLLGGFCLLPSLGKARGIAPGEGVEVLDRRIVGAFDTATLSVDSATSLDAWLKSNGFATSPAASSAASDYIARGWTFVAARLRIDEKTNEPLTPHPLGLKFAASAPVYPLKLTGTGSSHLKVELYVAADQMARAPGFRVASCTKMIAAKPLELGEFRAMSRGEFNHPQLAALVGDAQYITKLTASLSPSAMASDATITWAPPRSIEERFFTSVGALAVATVSGIGVCWLVAIAIRMRQLIVWKSRPAPAFGSASWLSALTIACLASAVVYALLPQVATTNKLRHQMRIRQLEYVGDELYFRFHELPADQRKGDLLAWARSSMPACMKEAWDGEYLPKEEDSPGNYTLQLDGGVLEFAYIDESGLRRAMRFTE